MAIFRGTGGSGSSSDSTIVDAVTAQATIATTKAGEASTSATTATTKASEASTSATTASTKATEANASATTASTKATEATTAKTGAETAQTAAEAARDAALGHSNTANSSAVQTVAGSNTQVVGVYNNIANVNTVAGVNTDVTTVAGISSDVTTVAADASDIGTVSTNIANVNNVGNNIANVNAVHGNASNINTVAADGTDIGTVATNIANVNTVAGVSSNVTTVAGLESKMDTVIADASDIGAVAGNIGDVTTVAGINSDVDTVAGIAAKVTTVADNITDVQNADTNATNAATSASNASASATSASNSATTATTKATEASNSATAASNSATTATTKASQAAGSATTAGTSASTATTKASEASASATTATTKAGEAASSASAASGSASTAVTKASEASASAASASTSATNATNASSTWNNFYTTYLGAADAPPTADVLGNALQTGAFYYDTGAGSNTVGLYVYNGSSWVYSTNYNNVTAPYSLAQDLATNSHDINFGDNAKAQFGASDDLQIYHDGSHSYIRDDGTGELRINSDNAVRIRKHDNETMAVFNNNGSVDLYYDNAVKLATTSTGVDVTGTVTADGLKVEDTTNGGLGHIRGLDASLWLDITSGNNAKVYYDSGDLEFKATNPNAVDSSVSMKIAQNRDISFYEDTGTTPKFFWDASTERLGIGTSTPATALDISQSNARGAYLRSSTTGSRMHFLDATTSSITTVGIGADGNNLVLHGGGAEFMRVASSGNVGIGTTSPARELSIGDGTGSPNIQLLAASAGNSRIEFGDTDDSDAGEIQYVHSSNYMQFTTNGTERLRIDSSGNLLVGTTSIVPQEGDHGFVARANGYTIASANNARVMLVNRGTSDGELINFRKDNTTVGSIGTVSSGDLYIADGRNAGLKLDGGNNQVLPVTSAGAQLDNTLDLGKSDARFKDLYLSGVVNAGDGSASAPSYTFGDDTNTGMFSPAADTIAFSEGGVERMRITSSGNVGIGTTSPSQRLHVNGGVQGNRFIATSNNNSIASAGLYGGIGLTIKHVYSSSSTTYATMISFTNNINGEAGRIRTNGSSTQYVSTSDERLKENIQDAGDAGAKIDAIQIRQFDWKGSGEHEDFGVIAQELQSVAPEAVSEGETADDMMGVDYSKLVPTLIKEIQSLRNRVAELENN